jgi:hypothetical protein
MRTTIVASAVVLAAGVFAPTAAAHASPDVGAKAHCATHAQYKRVKHGMTIARVAKILGHPGHIEGSSHEGGYGDEIRSYKACGEFSQVDVTFSHNPHKPFRESGKDGIFE